MADNLDIQYYSLDDIGQEFLKYAPAYAQKEAKQAIAKIQDLQSQGVIRSGLYYIVLVDLVDSTKYSADHGNEALVRRIQQFVLASFNGLNDSPIKNVGMFVKEIGDAVLFIFQHFPDVLRWKSGFDKFLAVFGHNDPFHIRTCIHLGEIYLDGVNPLSIATSHAFKIEKQVQSDHIVLTDPAYNAAWPTIARAYHGFEDYGTIELDGYDSPVRLHRLIIHDAEDTERIVAESIE